MSRVLYATVIALQLVSLSLSASEDNSGGSQFFEKEIRPLLVRRCYECHSEQSGKQEGGLLLDRRSGWIKGGDTEEAVLPGEPDESLLIKAVRYDDEKLQMPPAGKLPTEELQLLTRWVRLGAPGPLSDLGDTEFSRLGDQEFLFAQARSHWAFQPVRNAEPPSVEFAGWNATPVDRFVAWRLQAQGLTPSPEADSWTLIRRMSFDLNGLPPTMDTVLAFNASVAVDRETAIESTVARLLDSPAFGEHVARLWLDVARYADTDSFYRPDTRTPHYFPFAFTYRDYVVESFNQDKPFDVFVREQFAADLMESDADSPDLAALGFLTVGPHANRNPTEAIDDWIDVTTRGLMGITAACARCHDHKYEPVPTADYYSLHGVFSSIVRVHPLDEKKQPLVAGYVPSESDRADYEAKRAAIDKKIEAARGRKSKGNNRSVAVKLRDTELAQLLSFHPGAPARAMVVTEKKRPVEPVILIRGQASSRGDAVPRRFLKLLDAQQETFPADSSGRLQLAEKIVDPRNPLTARVFVNRVWGYVMGSHIVDTPSDFGLQGASPTHPELLDWLAYDFMSNGWSVKRLIRNIVLSRTYQQSSAHRDDMAAVDPQNELLWRSNRKHLSIEAIRDAMLAVSGQLDRTPRGRPGELWGKNYTHRRSLYGFINRFNLDPTLRAFDFPTPMQSQPARDESIVATQALFAMNSPFVIDQATALTQTDLFRGGQTNEDRTAALFSLVLQRRPEPLEVERFIGFLELERRRNPNEPDGAWRLAAQALMMSNEFQYVD